MTYALFARAFEYPAADAPVTPALATLLPDAAEPGDPGALAQEYTRLFDLGGGSEPCSLYEGAYSDSRLAVMEDALRFYQYFGLELDARRSDTPDHLCTELEFLHVLAHQQTEAGARDAGAYRRAERDFLERHPGRWVPQLCGRLQRENAAPTYARLAQALAGFLRGAHAALAGTDAPQPPGQQADEASA